MSKLLAGEKNIKKNIPGARDADASRAPLLSLWESGTAMVVVTVAILPMVSWIEEVVGVVEVIVGGDDVVLELRSTEICSKFVSNSELSHDFICHSFVSHLVTT